MKKLAVFGDSILRGITYSAEQSRYLVYKDYGMKAISEEIGLPIENKSRMGATILRGKDIIDSSAEEIGSDTAVLLEFGGNDCDFNWQEISDDPAGKHLCNTPEEEFLSAYRTTIRSLKAKGAKVALCSMLPIDCEKYFAWISKNKNPDAILSWLGDVSMIYRFAEHYDRLVEDLARSENCPLINLRDSFLLSHRYRDLLSADGIHPTEEGHALIHRVIAKELRTKVLA